jgi:hypothetical protein
MSVYSSGPVVSVAWGVALGEPSPACFRTCSTNGTFTSPCLTGRSRRRREGCSSAQASSHSFSRISNSPRLTGLPSRWRRRRASW